MSSNYGVVPGAKDGPVEYSIRVFCFSLSLCCLGGPVTQHTGPGQEVFPCYLPVWPLAVCSRLLRHRPRLAPASPQVAVALQSTLPVYRCRGGGREVRLLVTLGGTEDMAFLKCTETPRQVL